jgi:very-short-patch-repair endonuclease
LELSSLWLYLEQEWMRGRRGVAILRELLVERTPGKAPTDSELELELRRLIIRSGLPAPTHQYEVKIPQATIHVDLAYPSAKVAIEVDSYSWHMDKESFERDRERDNELSRRGWRVLRFTWAKIRYESSAVIELIKQHLASAISDSSAHLNTY